MGEFTYDGTVEQHQVLWKGYHLDGDIREDKNMILSQSTSAEAETEINV